MTKLTESHVIGRTDEPLKYQTIGSALDEITVRFDHLEALVVRHQDIRWTYGELHCEVNALAAGFLAIGLEPGDRIAQLIFAAVARAELVEVEVLAESDRGSGGFGSTGNR